MADPKYVPYDWYEEMTDSQGDNVVVGHLGLKIVADTTAANGLIILSAAEQPEFERLYAEAKRRAQASAVSRS